MGRLAAGEKVRAARFASLSGIMSSVEIMEPMGRKGPARRKGNAGDEEVGREEEDQREEVGRRAGMGHDGEEVGGVALIFFFHETSRGQQFMAKLSGRALNCLRACRDRTNTSRYWSSFLPVNV